MTTTQAGARDEARRMRLSKRQRAFVHAMFNGLCAYCGKPLAKGWHADHVEPCLREWWKKGGGVERPENDHIGNIMPACAPCNIDKHAMSLDAWRRKLADSCGVLARNHATYRHAIRFGLVVETGASIVFHFERASREPAAGEQEANRG